MSKQPPPAPTASAICPCTTIIKIVGRPGTGSLPRTIATLDPPPPPPRKGIPETRDENCIRIICNFLEEKLRCDELPCIERAHRLGARRDPGRGPRPIIVAFSFYRDTENTMSSANALNNSPFGISRDYPIEINRARQTLWPELKEARANNPRG